MQPSKSVVDRFPRRVERQSGTQGGGNSSQATWVDTAKKVAIVGGYVLGGLLLIGGFTVAYLYMFSVAAQASPLVLIFLSLALLSM